MPNLSIDESELSDIKINKTIQLVKKFTNLFAESKSNSVAAIGVEHSIDVGEHNSINQPPYRVSPIE